MTKVSRRLSCSIFETSLGWMGIMGSEAGLRSVVLPQLSSDVVRRYFDGDNIGAIPDAFLFGDLPQRLCRYLKGERVDFPDRLDLAEATSFQRSVWQIVCSISYGGTRSYAWVARQLGKAGGARAVGQALANNPLPVVIPCHRVIGMRGLGGYTGGLEFKRYLLELEAGCSSLFSPKCHPLSILSPVSPTKIASL